MKKVIILLILSLSINSYSQWLQVSVPTTSGLNNAFFVDDNIGYIVGGGEFNGYPNNTDGIILKTTDGGLNWTTIYNQNGVSLNHIFVIDSNIYVFGRDEMSQPLQITSTDNGENWAQSIPNFNTNTMYFSDNIIYVFDFENNTTKIKKIENGNISTIITDVGVFGVNGNELLYINNQFNTIYKSVDYGINWTALSGYPAGFGSNQSSSSSIKSFGNVIITHYTYPNHIAYSLDNGNTWIDNVDNTTTDNAIIINNSTLYSISLNNTVAYSNNLIDWQQQLDTGSIKLRNIYFYNDNLGFVLGDNGLLYRTENGGLGIDNDSLEKKIKVYPNPVKNLIKIEYNDIVLKKIELFDTSGKLIKVYKSNFNKLKLCNTSKGNYILKIETENGILSKKILIE